jgi:cysteine synthase
MTRLLNSGARAAVCASARNLGQALAYSGRSRQISTTVVACGTANAYKLERIRALGATVRIVDGDIEDARHLARQIANSENAFLVEDSENIDTCEVRWHDRARTARRHRAHRRRTFARRRRPGHRRWLRLQVSGSSGRNRVRPAERSTRDGNVMADTVHC